MAPRSCPGPALQPKLTACTEPATPSMALPACPHGGPDFSGAKVEASDLGLGWGPSAWALGQVCPFSTGRQTSFSTFYKSIEAINLCRN